MTPNPKLTRLSKMVNGQDGDCFVILAAKENLRTKEGKPYFRVVFRDVQRDAVCLIWRDGIFYQDCKDKWEVGQFYKIRALYRENTYGARLDLNRIRETTEADRFEGFDPDECRPASRVAADLIIEEILLLARTHIAKGPLLNLIQRIFKENRSELSEAPASRIHHHAYPGGLLEHTLSVVKIALNLVDHFQQYYPKQRKSISKSVVIAGAIVHDLGKMTEMEPFPIMPRHTIEGELIGHYVLGRDLICHYGPLVELDRPTQLQLEHIVLSHSRFPEWGTPKLPMSLEALIVHYADYAETTFASALRITELEDGSTPFTNKPGPFGIPMFRPIPPNY